MALTQDNKRRNVGILFGGRSVEHAISIITALEAYAAMDASRWNPVLVYLAPNGRWYTGEHLCDAHFYAANPQPFEKLVEVVLVPTPGGGGLSIRAPKRMLFGRGSDIQPIDIYMPLLHGTFGEDGCVQGLLELADVPYTGSGVLASALGMDKHLCKVVARASGVPVLPWALVEKHEYIQNFSAVRTRLRTTPGLIDSALFVKPRSLGSSVGIRPIAKSDDELDANLDYAFRYDTQALVEPAVEHKRELNVAVCSDPSGVRASVTEEPLIGPNVLSYKAKYLEGGNKIVGGSAGMGSAKRVIDPSNFPSLHKSSAINHAVCIYRALGCQGIARVDFIFDIKTDTLYFNEINTLPGSLAYYLWDKSQPPVTYTEMLSNMLDSALAKKQAALSSDRHFGFEALAPLTRKLG